MLPPRRGAINNSEIGIFFFKLNIKLLVLYSPFSRRSSVKLSRQNFFPFYITFISLNVCQRTLCTKQETDLKLPDFNYHSVRVLNIFRIEFCSNVL